MRVAEAVRKLTLEFPVEVQILSDERLGVEVAMLLPKVRTKVAVGFEIGAAVVVGASEGEGGVKSDVRVQGRVVYGEGYNEKNIGVSVNKAIAGRGFEAWDVALRELRGKLVATGWKGR